jgi:hypothetical protein
VQLNLPAGVSSDPNAAVYITAIRFEYGAVKVGFTTKNYSETTSLNSEYRDSNGVLTSPNAGEIENPTTPVIPGGTTIISPASIQVFAAEPDPSPNPIVALLQKIAPLTAPQPLAVEIVPLAEAKGVSNNWIPNAGRADYSQELVDLLGVTSKSGSPLKPATYLVRTTRAMVNEDIVSSVSAHISRSVAPDTVMYDKDQDRVLTREIVTFTADPQPPDIGSIVLQDSFLEHASDSDIVIRGGRWVDRNGNRLRVGRGGPASTGDTMALGLWFVIMAITLVCLILLRMTYGTGRKRKWVTDPVSDAEQQKGGTPR